MSDRIVIVPGTGPVGNRVTVRRRDATFLADGTPVRATLVLVIPDDFVQAWRNGSTPATPGDGSTSSSPGLGAVKPASVPSNPQAGASPLHPSDERRQP